MTNPKNSIILDFTEQEDGGWQAVDDRIMGGCSQSHPKCIKGVGLRFAGHVSMQNNGGFASIRSTPGIYDLGRYSGLKLRLRGDGKTYKLSLRTDLFYDGISYQSTFTTTEGDWQEISLPFEAFAPTHHGIKLSTVAPLDTSHITSFGLFISERQEGAFKLDIAWVRGIV